MYTTQNVNNSHTNTHITMSNIHPLWDGLWSRVFVCTDVGHGVRVQGAGSLLGLLLLQCCGEGGDVVGGEVGEGGL